MNLTILNNENPSLCSKCTNVCCEQMPGINSPEDFGEITKEKIESLISGGKYAIDCWDGNPDIYYIRPNIVGNTKVLDRSWGGECIFLEEKCTLSFNDRPLNCRMLIPDENGCNFGGIKADKKYFADMWLDYQDILIEIIEDYE